MKDSNSYITASNLSMHLVQYNESGGIDKIIFDEISGSNNKMKLGQGVAWDNLSLETNLDWSHDGNEGGGHEMNIILYGDYNYLAGHQTNQGSTDGHEFNFDYW